jgi:CheY-like chemotaxis protein
MSKGHIVLALNERSLATVMERALQAHGYTVQVCSSAAEALDQLRRTPADLLVVDLALPDRSGLELLRLAQAQGRLRTLCRADGSPCLSAVILSDFHTQPRWRGALPPLAWLPRLCPLGALLRLVESSVWLTTGNRRQAAAAGLPAGGTLI